MQASLSVDQPRKPGRRQDSAKSGRFPVGGKELGAQSHNVERDEHPKAGNSELILEEAQIQQFSVASPLAGAISIGVSRFE